MKRKNRTSKNGLVGVIVGTTIGILFVGTLGAVSKGFRDWNVDNWFNKKQETIDTRIGLATIDLKNDIRGKELNSTTLITFLNDGLGEHKPIFQNVDSVEDETGSRIDLLNKVYQDNGGLRFGSSKDLGYFTINLVEDFAFNRVKIIGRNYSAINNTTNEYSCDESSISVNGAENQVFSTNAEDPTKIAPTEEKVFSFPDKQNKLNISVLGKRATIFEIQLWTELVEESDITEK